MPAAKKTAAAKAAEEKAAETVKEVKTTAKKAPAAKKETAPKAPKAPAAKKETAPKAPKAPAKKTAVKATVFVEFQGRQVDVAALLEAVKAEAGAVSDLQLYVKPEDSAVYYVGNEGSVSGKIDF